MHTFLKKPLILLALFFSASLFATTYDLPTPPNTLVGQVQQIKARSNTVTDIDKKYDVGYTEMVEANPNLTMDVLSYGQMVTVPTQFILPDTPHKDIVVNIAEMRLYYYPADQKQVMTFPIGIGKEGRYTPIGKTDVVLKAENPEWNPTPQVRDDFLKLNGYPLPKLVMPGPDNPLGQYSMILGIPTYLIHGSIDPSGIGRRSSAGCIRMFNEDIGSFFSMVVPKQTQVTLIYEPYKAGWSGDTLYLEAHAPITIDYPHTPDYKVVIKNALKQRPNVKTNVDWEKAAETVKLALGVPQPIG